MASYSVAANEIGVHAKKLTANTVDTVVIHGSLDLVEVVTDGTSALYVSVDGSTPTVGGANTYFLPEAICSRQITINKQSGSTDQSIQVKLISSGTPTYSISREER